MGYSKTTWAKGDKITSSKLNKLEEGIEAAINSTEQNKNTLDEQVSVNEDQETRLQAAESKLENLPDQEDINTLSSSVEEVRSKVNAQAETIIVLDESVQTAKTERETLRTDVDEVKSTAAAQATQLENIQTDISAKTELDNTQTEDITALKSSMQSQVEKSTQNAENIEEIKTALNGQDEVDATHTADIQSNKEKIEDLTTQISEKTTVDASQENRLTSLESAVEQNTSALSNVETKVFNIEAKVHDLDDALDNVNITLEGQNTSIQENNTAIEHNSTSIDTLTQTVAEINALITELNTSIEKALSTLEEERTTNQRQTIESSVLNSRLNYLEYKTSQNTESAVTLTSESMTNGSFNDPQADAIITAGALNSQVSSITANSIDMSDLGLDSQRVALTATSDVNVSNVTNTGTVSKDVSNAVYSINNSGEVYIHGMTFQDGASYNAVEIGLGTTAAPTAVNISDCTFDGSVNNVAILIFNTADNAVINIVNCHFKKTSEAIRLSNRNNVHVTLNCLNCSFDEVDANMGWAGIILCQDYMKGTAEDIAAANRFGPDKVKINFVNCTFRHQKMVQPASITDVCNTMNENQLIVVWNNYENSTSADKPAAAYVSSPDGSRFPELKIS